MIQLKITNSNILEVLGSHEYEWNEISFGGPQGLQLTKDPHPQIKFKIIATNAPNIAHHIQIDAPNFPLPLHLNGIPMPLPILCNIGDKLSWGPVEIEITSFGFKEHPNIESKYQEERRKINENSLEWPLLKELLNEQSEVEDSSEENS